MMDGGVIAKAPALRACSIGVLALLLIALLSGAGMALGQEQRSLQQRPPAAPPGSGDIAADYWRALRQGEAGYVPGAATTRSDLINISGQTWMVQRNDEVTRVGAWVFAVIVGALALFFLLRGRVRIDGGWSGRVVERWPLAHRVIHWWVAILFIVQLVTGLLLLYGKPYLMPLVGKDTFATLALVSKNGHNYLGPLLFVGMVVMIVAWVHKNLPKWVDVVWFAKGGGVIGKGHPKAEFCNGGEKAWFWVVVVVGGVMVGTGLVLDFPIFGQTRETMQEMHYLHALSGLIVGAAMLGHIYIGTLGTEGAFMGMYRGYVDVNWAKQHHSLWYETVKNEAVDADEVMPGVIPEAGGKGKREESGEARTA